MEKGDPDNRHQNNNNIYFCSTCSLKTSSFALSYHDAEFIHTKRRELFSRTDVVANVGGILGLFLGFSIVSFSELIYFFIIYPYIVHRQKLKSKKNGVAAVETVIDLKAEDRRNVKFLQSIERASSAHFGDYIP